ncbi:MAG: LytTR family DNA-binding domain-containing protein [Bacteroidota bacterium]|jgi:two-component system LytT family response regulator
MNFVVVNQKQKIRIPTNNIIMLEGHSNYTLFHLQNGKQRMYAHTLGYFQELLDSEQFIRIHRGFLVNSSYIVGYNKTEHKLQMENNLEAIISRRRRKNLPIVFLGESEFTIN